MTTKQLEAEAILAALHSTHWNRKRAAAKLNIDYKALLYKMKKLGIESKAQPPSATAPAPTETRNFPADLVSLEEVGELQKQAEARAILSALATTRWNRKQAARLLNLDYKALLYKMKKLSIADGPLIVINHLKPSFSGSGRSRATDRKSVV